MQWFIALENSPSNTFSFTLPRLRAGQCQGQPCTSAPLCPAPTDRVFHPLTVLLPQMKLSSFPVGSPLGSAPFQKEFSSPRRCSEDNLETKVKCNSFAHPCNWNRGEGCCPTVVSSHSLVTVNPGTATFYALFLHIFLRLLYLFLFLPLISILHCSLPIPGLLQGDLCSCLETYLAVGLCLNKSSQKSFLPSHTLQFCISG